MSHKILFQCDYNEGAHPRIMERLTETNMEQTVGYGEDEYCKKAADKIRSLCQNENLAVHFLVGGTQTNMTVIDAALRSHQGVLCAKTGHINVHETGAVESCGHKVLGLVSEDGKISAGQVEEAYLAHIRDASFEHMVQPKMVYISNPTEMGTIYGKAELTRLSQVCRKYGLYLFLDGARLGYGLTAPDNDLTLTDIAELCDVFYIGGTKVGALFGEAVVIAKEELKEDFRYFIKQKGGMLAKGRLLGIQFDTLFTDNLYLEISKEAIRLAEKLRDALERKGYSYLVQSHTNQIFVIMPDEKLKELSESFGYSYDHAVDENHSAVRLCTSWATREENVDALIEAL
ncbi:MAG: low specificity L-threonine aldolase [Bacteroidales bacterium]|nr:low specificity L-threonine aldolase [Lachnoclostridium sp.]MCM1385464.1 low specificity L-threonine aldolase [Lachnoclostridium sp.]MCM1466250.1 low specificity L-threonine aldolase [Bacteroidales bacterium]